MIERFAAGSSAGAVSQTIIYPMEVGHENITRNILQEFLNEKALLVISAVAKLGGRPSPEAKFLQLYKVFRISFKKLRVCIYGSACATNPEMKINLATYGTNTLIF